MTGTTSRVSRVEVAMPPIVSTAMAARASEPEAVESATGSRPQMSEKAVIRTGRRRAGPASRMASRRERPSWRSRLM